VALVLLAVVFYGYDPAAQLLGSTPARWGYVLHGYGGMVLALLAALASRQDRQAVAIFLWVAFEEFLVGGCGALRLYDPPNTWPFNPYSDICGGPVNFYKIGVLACSVFAYLVARTRNRKWPM
jgi:hypothetical protein